MRLMEKTDKIITSFTVPVRKSDIDVNGHVNNGTYQSYFEEARIKTFQLLKEEGETILSSDRLVVRQCEIEYKAELKYPEDAIVTTDILHSDPESTEIMQEIFRASDSVLVCKAKFVLSLFDDTEEVFYSEEDYPYAFYHPISVGWAEMDPEGKVNLETIQYYLDDARIRSSYQCGLDLHSLQAKGIGPVVYKAELNYFDTMGFPDDFVVVTVYQKAEKNRLAFRHDVFSKKTKKLILTSIVHGLFMDLKRKRPHQFTEEEMKMIFSVKNKSLFD
ncbi:acyl-CoA thioesterase [Leptospira koniambonensis]|uniref:Acyl-CoA thioesterase n=1 Tax=Leptospira koniambonensis TaxID=2484950 RepID=A0A4V3JNC4_9LEPT|nr:acyl-CoA thioesterase [Leptospira koniambonensis]